jgi:hypothetical protein
MALHPDAGKQSRWLHLVRHWQQSHLTVRAFCQRHRLSEPRFYSWRRVLARRASSPPPRVMSPANPIPNAFATASLPANLPA